MDATQQEKLIEELRAKHGPDVGLYEALGYVVAIRPPSAAEFNKFMANGRSDREDKKSRAMEFLFRDVCVYPDKVAVSEMLAKKPGLALSFGEIAMELCGAGVAVEKKA